MLTRSPYFNDNSTSTQLKSGNRSVNRRGGKEPVPRSRSGWSWLWLALWLGLAAFLSLNLAGRSEPEPVRMRPVRNTGGTLRVEPIAKPIQTIQVGDSVLAHNPGEDADLEFGVQVEPEIWRRVELLAPKQDGSTAEVVLLRPVWWLEVMEARVGGTIEIAVPECGIDGDAQVLAIQPCPAIDPPTAGYRTVTGTYKHLAAQVIDLYVEGLDEPIGVTPNHPFWSIDQEDFIPAGLLEVGERLADLAGEPRVVKIVPRDGSEAVYNLEVQVEHAYYVSEAGLLVHNTPWGKTPFCKWFNKLTLTELKNLMAVTATRNAIKRALRGAGGLHEWLMVSKAVLSKRWGLTAEQIREFTTGTKKLHRELWKRTKDRAGGRLGHKGEAGARFHKKLEELMEQADAHPGTGKQKFEKFKELLQEWAREDGFEDLLPDGLK